MTNLSESLASQEQPQGGASQGTSVTVLVPDAVAALGGSSADYDGLSDEQVLAGRCARVACHNLREHANP